MKQCPKCENVFDDSREVCLKDSTQLINLDKSDIEVIDYPEQLRERQEESIEKMSSFIGHLIGVFLWYLYH